MTVTHKGGNAESSESQTVEMSNRMEDVPVSWKRGAEENGSPGDGSHESATSLMPLQLRKFADTAVDAGFERGLGVDHATG